MSPRDEWTLVTDGLDYPESLRWHQGALWCSDFYQRRVLRVVGGSCETVLPVLGQPSGLGWLPDGRLLVVDMHGKRVLRVERDQQVQLHADLSDFCTGLANDLVVTSDGDAYVGHLGFDFFGGERFRTAELLHVSPDGYVEVAADGLAVPNGCIVSPDRTELVVAETFAGGLTRFDRDEGGKLSGRAPWAKLPGASPDGICSAGDGAIWVADPVGSRVMKVQRGGIVEMEIATPAPVYSCALGGHEGTTLFAGVADGHDPAVTPPGTGCILSVELDG